jgi:hypothetical protein
MNKHLDNAYIAASLLTELRDMKARRKEGGSYAMIVSNACELIRNSLDNLSFGDLSEYFEISPARIDLVKSHAFELASAWHGWDQDEEDAPDGREFGIMFRRVADLKRIASGRDGISWVLSDHWADENGFRIYSPLKVEEDS